MSEKIFDVIQVEKPNRNSFDLVHDYKTTMDMGELVPCCILECLPGDRYTIGSEALVRFAPMIAPTMQRYDARIEYFFVPNRLVWDKWMQFIASDPSQTGSIPAFPYIEIDNISYTPLMNRMGIPKPIPGFSENVNAIPFAAYQLIYETYYRDQNLIIPNPAGIKLQDGDNTANLNALCLLKHRSWEHDYFTSCLPFAQKGDPVTIGAATFPDVPVKKNTPGTNTFFVGGKVGSPVGADDFAPVDYESTSNPGGLPANGLYADTSTLAAFSITINDLREAEALQKWLEINARAGTRPNEVIMGHFGVKSSDARLQRPEYIVGVKQPISVSEVLNTTGLEISGSGGSPQGTMAGHGVSMIDDQNYGSYFCEEHGFIIGIMSVMPKTSYMQGLRKFWLKTKDATDYYFPSFAHLGEQPVLNKEIYAFQGPAGDDTFGYLPAYEDYRSIPSMVTGDFQDSLSYWTATRIFDAPPALNTDFIWATPRKDIFAVNDPDVNSLYVHVLNKVFASKLIPVYGTPSL